MRYSLLKGVALENHSLCPRVTLLPNRPCFPINTKHFRRLPRSLRKRNSSASSDLAAHVSQLRSSVGPTSLGNCRKPTPKPTVAWWRPIPFPVEFPPDRVTVTLASATLSIFACHCRGERDDCSRSRNGNITSNSVCHPVPHTNREFLFRSDIPVYCVFLLSTVELLIRFVWLLDSPSHCFIRREENLT